jgi:D-alanyl-D-alanine carboxypeptidase
VSLRVTFAGRRPPIGLAEGTTRYDGGPPVSPSALWQIGSNTKAFTAVILLQLEAEGRLSINDPIGKWLPQYPAWRHITIRQLLDMTSRIPDYASQPAFLTALAANLSARFTAAQLVSYVTGLPLGPAGYQYTNTDYILAQMIIEKVTGDSYASQLTRRIIDPLRRLRATCLAPYTCPPSDAAAMPAGYLYQAGIPPPLLGQAMPACPDLAPGRRRHRQLTGRHDQMGPRPLLRTAPAAPPAAPARIPGIRDHRQTHPPHHPRGPVRLRARRHAQTTRQTGTIWDYEGETFVYEVVHYYFPRSGMIIALAVNSATGNDDIADLAGSVYQTLEYV